MNHQAGFSIITVIFVLVVLAGLGAVMAQLGATQHLGMAMAQEGRQAYYAARAGLEWGRDRLIKGNTCTTSTLVIEGFDVEVRCTPGTQVAEAEQKITPYLLGSTASGAAPSPYGQVSRRLEMSVWKTTNP
ncbi:MAG: hypothetical protein ACOZAP_00640 [Pseudomonadota bacterium]|jgi:MSHA biogenesis protein MshP